MKWFACVAIVLSTFVAEGDGRYRCLIVAGVFALLAIVSALEDIATELRARRVASAYELKKEVRHG